MPEATPFQVMIVDDHPLMRRGVRQLLELDPGFEVVRDSVRRFVEREMLPGVEQWEEAESFPRELYLKAGAAGILGIGYPEALGGSHEGDLFAKVAASEELMRCGSGGVVAGLGSLDIGLPPVVKWARPEVRERVAPLVLAGEKIIALAVTEPGDGSSETMCPLWLAMAFRVLASGPDGRLKVRSCDSAGGSLRQRRRTR